MTQQITYKLNSIEDIETVSEQIVDLFAAKNINLVLLSGSMGAGKTTLVRGLCAAMEVIDTVTSPTFALVNEYSTQYGDPIYHFDVYRIDSVQEVVDIGYEEYLYSGNLCMIEWWQKMDTLIPPTSGAGLNIAEIDIQVLSPESRELTISFR